MACLWLFVDGGGVERGSSEPFPDRAAAEAWLGEQWARLVEDGVAEVILIAGVDRSSGQELYRMSLAEG